MPARPGHAMEVSYSSLSALIRAKFPFSYVYLVAAEFPGSAIEINDVKISYLG